VDVVTDDPAAPLDLPAWCHLTGHHYLGPVGSEIGSAYRIAVTAEARQVERTRPWATRT
jgi:tRNA 2-thiouridine synthesizing protein A